MSLIKIKKKKPIKMIEWLNCNVNIFEYPLNSIKEIAELEKSNVKEKHYFSLFMNFLIFQLDSISPGIFSRLNLTIVIASLGQVTAHNPQPIHFSEFTSA